MRVAVISDIHANLTALEAVLADLEHTSPDLIVHGGDLVGSGARPAEVVDCIRALGWPGIHGNSDEMLWKSERVAEYFQAPILHPWREVVARTIAATLDDLNPERLSWLRGLPLRWADKDLTIVHASPSDCWRSPRVDALDEDLLATYGLRQPRVTI
jgi:3',5'-cyclic AMP phosphodiesterase CpdA